MIRLQGFWFDGKTSHKVAGYLDVEITKVIVRRADDQQILLEAPVENMEISSRVGSTPRYCYFPNGGKFETLDHAKADEIVVAYKPSLYRTLVHKLESHLGFVAITLVIVVFMGWAGVKYGLPAASHAIAMALPQSVMDRAATETLQILDKIHFGPSKLPEDVQKRVLKHFDAAIQDNKHLGIKVLFRDGRDIGANAFALPDGTVVFTDQIVELADNDDELLAVFAHEIGHVEHRHSLRGVIQASALSFAITMLVGDVSAMGDLLVNLPILLTTSAYSRDFEREADDHSLLFLDKHNIPRHSFIDLMDKLSKDHQCRFLLVENEPLFSWNDDKKEPDEKQKQSSEKPKAETHPKESSDNKKVDVVIVDSKAEKSEADKESDLMSREAYEQLNKKERRLLCDRLIAKEKAKGKDSKLDDVMAYFSSHPATEERLEKFRTQPQTK